MFDSTWDFIFALCRRCGSVGFIGCNLRVALQLSEAAGVRMIPSRSEAMVCGVATPSEGTVTQGRGV